MSNLLLGQLRHTKAYAVSIPAGGIVKIPFNIADYADNVESVVPHGYFKVKSPVNTFTGIFNVAVSSYRELSRVEVPLHFALRVNSKIVGWTTATTKYYADSNITTFIGAIGIDKRLNVGDTVDLIAKNAGVFSQLSVRDCLFIINDGLTAGSSANPGEDTWVDNYVTGMYYSGNTLTLTRTGTLPDLRTTIPIPEEGHLVTKNTETREMFDIPNDDAQGIEHAGHYRVLDTTINVPFEGKTGSILATYSSASAIFMIYHSAPDNDVYVSADRAITWEQISGISALTGGILNQRIRGTVTWTGVGLIFDVSDWDYYIQGIVTHSLATQLTLDTAHPTLDRLDVIYVDADGLAGFITGTPSANPAKPIVDSLTQLECTVISVPAGATVPGGITDEVVYDENIEWTTSSGSVSGITVDFEDTTDPVSGTKDIKISSTSNIRNGNMTFTDTLTNDITGAKFYFYLKTSGKWYWNTQLTIEFSFGGTLVKTARLARSIEMYGFDHTSTDWQKVAIDLDTLISIGSAADIDRIKITANNRWRNGVELLIDKIILQYGIIIPPQETYNLLTQNDELRTSFPTPGDDVSNIIHAGFYRVGSLTGSLPYTDSKGLVIASYQSTALAGMVFLHINETTDAVYVSHDKGSNWTQVGAPQNLVTTDDAVRSSLAIPSDDCQSIVAGGFYKVETTTENTPIDGLEGTIIAGYRSSSPDDLFLAYHSENDDYYISSDLAQTWTLISGIEDFLNIVNQLIYGVVTWTGVGLIFDVSPCRYYIQGPPPYISPAAQHTLTAAHTTLNRIDVFYVDTDSVSGFITGTPATNPVKPIVDPITQLELTQVYVPAGATEPGGITDDLVYDENAGTPTEWATSSVAVTDVTVDFNDTSHPYSGSKAISITHDSGGSIQNGNVIFTDSATKDITGATLYFYLNSSRAWYKNGNLVIRFYNGGTVIKRASMSARTNLYGYDPTDSNWQKVAIDLDTLPSTSGEAEIDKITITCTNRWPNGLEMLIDKVVLQQGVIMPPQETYNLLTQNDELRTSFPTPGDDVSNIVHAGLYRVGSLTGSMPYTGSTGVVFAMYQSTAAAGMIFLHINEGDDSIYVSHDKGTSWTQVGIIQNLLTQDDTTTTVLDIPSDDCQDIVKSGLYKVTTSTTNGPVASKAGVILASYRSSGSNDIYLFYHNEDGDLYESHDLAQNWAVVGGGSGNLVTTDDTVRSSLAIPSGNCQSITAGGFYKVETSTTNTPVASKEGIIIASYRSSGSNDIYLFYHNEDGDLYESHDLAQNWSVVGGSSSPLTTKGDVYVFGSADARLPVGTNDQVLTADSAETLGVKWATPSGGASPLTTKGDLFTFGSADARLPIGTDGDILEADSGETLGVKWGGASGLEKITEGSNTGWRLRGVDPTYYGNIGANAIDLSISTGVSSVNGATGVRSFCAGQNSIASGSDSYAVGDGVTASSNSSYAVGDGVTASGSDSYCVGLNGTASGSRAICMGSGGLASGSYSAVIQGGTASGQYAFAWAGATATGIRAWGRASNARAYGTDCFVTQIKGQATAGTEHNFVFGASSGYWQFCSGDNMFVFQKLNSANITQTGDNCAILGGTGNQLNGADNAVILAGTNLVATLDDCVYLPQIKFESRAKPTGLGSGDAGLTLLDSTSGKLECWDGSGWNELW